MMMTTARISTSAISLLSAVLYASALSMSPTPTPNKECVEHDAVTLALAKKESAHHFHGMDALNKAMLEKPLLVKAYAVDDILAPPISDPNVKICHFLRHGQGFHNLMADMAAEQGKEWTQFQNTEDNPYVKAEIEDAPLTQKGRNQARAVQRIVHKMKDKPSMIVSSPQCRALQTSLIAFEPLIDSVPFIVHENLREETGVHVCDRRRPKTQQMIEFPQFSFDLIKDEEDVIFMEDRRETKIEIGERIYNFLEWLEGREDRYVGIASHSGWLMTLFNGVVQCDESLKPWFQTGELRSIKLAFEKKSSED